MLLIGRTKNCALYTKVPIPEKDGDYIYFLSFPQEGTEEKKLVKIGTTNNIMRRMREHLNYYETDVIIEWISKPYSKWTTLQVEDKFKKIGIQLPLWEWVRNDRFLIPKIFTTITVTVRKDYVFEIE